MSKRALIVTGELIGASTGALISGSSPTANGTGSAGLPGTFPALSGSKVVTGPKEAQITVVLNGVVKGGKPTAMVAFGKQLSDVDIAAVITYTRNNWANNTGEAVTPADVKAARK